MQTRLVYMDDISVATHDLEEHRAITGEMLKLLAEAGLKLNFKKCQIAFTAIDYLGYRIDEHGIRPNGRHLQAIREYPAPRDVRGVQRCSGVVLIFPSICA